MPGRSGVRALAACLLLVGAGPLLAACGRDEQAAPAAPAHATAPGPIGTAPTPTATARPSAPGERAGAPDCVAIWNARVGSGSEPWPYPRVQVAVYVATHGYGCGYRFYDARRFAVWSALLTSEGPVWPPDQGRDGRLTPGALAGFERWRDAAVDRNGAIRGVAARVPDEPSTLPVGTHLPNDRVGDPARPAPPGTGELPVPVWRYPATRAGMAELITGRVHLDRTTGCVTLDGRPALWPTGTWVTERPFVVHLPGRVVARDGDVIEGGGGEEPPRWARQLAEPSVEGRDDALACLDAGGTVTALNAAGEVRVVARSR